MGAGRHQMGAGRDLMGAGRDLKGSWQGPNGSWQGPNWSWQGPIKDLDPGLGHLCIRPNKTEFCYTFVNNP